MFLFDHIIDIREEPTRPGPDRPGRNAFCRVNSLTVQKVRTGNFSTISKVFEKFEIDFVGCVPQNLILKNKTTTVKGNLMF